MPTIVLYSEIYAVCLWNLILRYFHNTWLVRIPITDVVHRVEKNGGRKEVVEKESVDNAAKFDRELREPIGGIG